VGDVIFVHLLSASGCNWHAVYPRGQPCRTQLAQAPSQGAQRWQTKVQRAQRGTAGVHCTAGLRMHGRTGAGGSQRYSPPMMRRQTHDLSRAPTLGAGAGAQWPPPRSKSLACYQERCVRATVLGPMRPADAPMPPLKHRIVRPAGGPHTACERRREAG